MPGLSSTPAATSSLLLNLEGVLTAVIAWVVFRENVDLQVFLGMVAIVAGGVMLSWTPGNTGVSAGALLIVGACLCWAIDNNLTRKVSANDAMVIACLKGLIAGPVNLAIAVATGACRLRREPCSVCRRASSSWNRTDRCLLLGRTVVRCRHFTAHLARTSVHHLLDRRSIDGAWHLASSSRAPRARAYARTDGALTPAPAPPRRTSSARARLSVCR